MANCNDCFHVNVCEWKYLPPKAEKCEDFEAIYRCKECDWYDTDCETCKLWRRVRHPEHFCGEGVPKNNGNK